MGVVMDWTEKVHAALQQGLECQKIAVELIVAARREHSLSQREIAKALDKSTTWVSRMLKWHKEGCHGAPFGPEAPLRRKIATSQQKASAAVKAVSPSNGRVGKRAKPKPKYRSKKDRSLKWTGRGVLPVWMRNEMKGTKLTKDDFLIKA